MKSVNKAAARVFEAVVRMIPEGKNSTVLDHGKQAEGGSVMALHVEKIGSRKNGDFYSFAHYYEQNGDLMRDPDVVMLRVCPSVLASEPIFFPTAYRQDGLGIDREYVTFEESGYRIAKHAQADLAVFCGQWAKNLKEQQAIEA